MLVLWQILLITLMALALCIYTGWGLAYLALPQATRPYTTLLIPLIGYALSAWAGYMGVSTLLNLRWSLAVLLLITTLLNLLAWRRGARLHPLRFLQAELPLLAILALCVLAGVLPLLQYGYITSIGRGWDTESYLPMAQHLVDYPLAQIGTAPLNPLRDLVRDPPRIGLTLAFSVLQGFTMLLSGQSALDTFAPLLALLRIFGVLSVYIWLRAAMGLGRPAALLAALLAGLGSLMLWVTFFNFGMQLSSWPLIGLGLLVGLATVDDLSQQGFAAWPQALLGALVLAALPVAYYPALTVFAPMAGGLGLARVIEALRNSRTWAVVSRLALASLALAVLTLVLAAPTIVDYFEGFSFRYSLVAQKIGPDQFIPATDTLGLSAFRLQGGGQQPPALLVWLAAILTSTLLLAGLFLRPKRQDSGEHYRLRWLLVLVPMIIYLAWLQYGRPYEYAHMKTSAYAGCLFWGLALLGWQKLWERASRQLRVGLAGLVMIPILVAGWSQALILAEHGRSPALFGRDLTALEEIARQVPADATVLISSDERFVGPNAGLFSTIFYGRTIMGQVATAYSSQNYWPEGTTPQYALLAAGEPAWPLQIGGRELWRSRAVALYQFDSDIGLLRGRTGLYTGAPPGDTASPAAMALWRRAGPQRSITPTAPLELLLGDTIRYGPGEPVGNSQVRRLQLTLATLAAQSITIRSGNQTHTLELAPGVSTISLALNTPVRLVFEPQAEVALIDAIIEPAESIGEPLIAPLAGSLAWSVAAGQRDTVIQLHLQTANPEHIALRFEITLVEDTFDGPQRPARLLGALPLDSGIQLALDPIHGASEAIVNTTAVPLLQAELQPNPPDGAYFGILTLYSGEEIIAHEPIFTVRVAQGQLSDFTAVPFSIEASQAGPAGATANLRSLLADRLLLDDRQAALEHMILAREPAWPGALADAPFARGAALTAELYWRAEQPNTQPLMVSLQVLGADDRKWAQWDGPVGGEWHSIQHWQPGERLRQDVPLMLDPAIPPGNYRLVLIVYDPATGTPRPIAGQQTLLLGEISVE